MILTAASVSNGVVMKASLVELIRKPQGVECKFRKEGRPLYWLQSLEEVNVNLIL